MTLLKERGWHCEAWCVFGLASLHATTWLIPLVAFRLRKRWSRSERTWILPFCWSTRETWSWRCCRKMRSWGRRRRRGYGEDLAPFESVASLMTPLMIFSLCQTGDWRTSYWKWNTKASIGHRRLESGSALAASSPWVWSLGAVISARNVSCASAMTAALNYPTPTSGGVTCVPRSRKSFG